MSTSPPRSKRTSACAPRCCGPGPAWRRGRRCTWTSRPARPSFSATRAPSHAVTAAVRSSVRRARCWARTRRSEVLPDAIAIPRHRARDRRRGTGGLRISAPLAGRAPPLGDPPADGRRDARNHVLRVADQPRPGQSTARRPRGGPATPAQAPEEDVGAQLRRGRDLGRMAARRLVARPVGRVRRARRLDTRQAPGRDGDHPRHAVLDGARVGAGSRRRA